MFDLKTLYRINHGDHERNRIKKHNRKYTFYEQQTKYKMCNTQLGVEVMNMQNETKQMWGCQSNRKFMSYRGQKHRKQKQKQTKKILLIVLHNNLILNCHNVIIALVTILNFCLELKSLAQYSCLGVTCTLYI